MTTLFNLTRAIDVRHDERDDAVQQRDPATPSRLDPCTSGGILSLSDDIMMLIQGHVCVHREVVVPAIRSDESGYALEGSSVGRELRRAEKNCGMVSSFKEHPPWHVTDHGAISGYVMGLEQSVCAAVKMEVERNLRGVMRLVCTSFGHIGGRSAHIGDARHVNIRPPDSHSHGFMFKDMHTRVFLFDVKYNPPSDDQSSMMHESGDAMCLHANETNTLCPGARANPSSTPTKASRVLYAITGDDGKPVYGECELYGVAVVPIEICTDGARVSDISRLVTAWGRAVAEGGKGCAQNKRTRRCMASSVAADVQSATDVVLEMVNRLLADSRVNRRTFDLEPLYPYDRPLCREKTNGCMRGHKRGRLHG